MAHKVAPSIATNNRMVLKPSEKTPLSALLLADMLYEAGLPPEMFSVVTGDPREIADELLTHADVDLVTFTGGVAIGKYIAAKAVYKRQVLELGGNDPLIVMEDADLEEAATLAALGSYKNSGQRCTAIKRMLVHEPVARRFIELLVAKSRAVKYGDPMDPKTDMGTVIDEAAAQSFEARVNEAVAAGRAAAVRQRPQRGAVLPDRARPRRPEMTVVTQETFGPVSPVIRFASIDEAMRIANSTAYGLSSAVCTNRLDYITRFITDLKVGSVNVREVPGYRLELTPFGGIKDSGLGYKEGVQEAIKSFTNTKTYSLPWPDRASRGRGAPADMATAGLAPPRDTRAAHRPVPHARTAVPRLRVLLLLPLEPLGRDAAASSRSSAGAASATPMRSSGIGSMASAGVFAYAMGKWFLTSLGDYWGGKRNLLIATGGATLFTLLFASSSTLPMFTIAWIGNRARPVDRLVGAHQGVLQVVPLLALRHRRRDPHLQLPGGRCGCAPEHGLAARARRRLARPVRVRRRRGRPHVPRATWCSCASRASRKAMRRRRPIPRNVFAGRAAAPHTFLELVLPLLRSRAFLIVCLLGFATTMVRETFNTWTPQYLHDFVGTVRQSRGGLSAVFPGSRRAVGAARGWASDRLGPNARALLLIVGLAATAAALLVLTSMPPALPAPCCRSS